MEPKTYNLRSKTSTLRPKTICLPITIQTFTISSKSLTIASTTITSKTGETPFEKGGRVFIRPAPCRTEYRMFSLSFLSPAGAASL